MVRGRDPPTIFMSGLSEKILTWYAENKRKLPWRDHPSPYAVWVSEIMLQQTRVDTVIPYYYRWMARFPGVQELAAASEQEVLSLWEGLGYYSRARNLHKAARIVMESYHGELPDDPLTLSGLPGIGAYTCGAIASIAFNLDTPVLDGNLKRVLARVYNVDKPIDLPEGEKELQRLASENLPKGHAGDFNQAMMDLGATICLPRNPACPLCPFKLMCESNKKGLQDQRPVMKPKTRIPHITVTAAILAAGWESTAGQAALQGIVGRHVGVSRWENGRRREPGGLPGP